MGNMGFKPTNLDTHLKHESLTWDTWNMKVQFASLEMWELNVKKHT
jgi:hypothetical protein